MFYRAPAVAAAARSVLKGFLCVGKARTIADDAVPKQNANDI